MAEKYTSTPEVPSAANDDNKIQGQRVKHFCQPCSKNKKETTAAVFCPTCDELQCKECSNIHKFYGFMTNHKLVDAGTAYKQSYDMKGLDRCEKHDKTVKFFCNDHEKLCCSTCAIGEHRKCNQIDEIKSMNADVDEKEQTLKIKISKMKEKGEAVLKCWTDGEKMMHVQLQKVLQRLTEIRISVNKKLDEVENNIKQQAASLSEMKAKEYARNRLECEGIVNDLKRCLDLLDDVKNHGAPDQQFIAKQRLNESYESMCVKASDEWLNLEKNDISLQVNPKLEDLLDLTEKLASLKTNTSKVTVDYIVEGMPVKLKTIASIDLQKGGDETEAPFFTGMDFLPDGRLVVVDNNNDKCIVLNDQLEQLGSCKLYRKPYNIVSVSENEVAVTTWEEICFLCVSKSNEITQIRTVTTTSKCDSICMKDDDHFIVGIYDDTNPVRVISFSGEEKHLNVDFPDKTFAIDDSTCTYIQNSDKVVLTDRCEHTVYVYYLKDNLKVVVKDDRIKEPRGVAIGPFDSIFVCSDKTNSVVQLSQTGRILSYHETNMEYPSSVCVSKDRTKLAVSNNIVDERKLQLLCMNV